MQNCGNINVVHFSYYAGEFDSYNLKHCGAGKHVKQDYYFYNGTFLNGKKNGFGYIFRLNKNSEYFYYIGEWEDNLPHGFGIAYIYPKEHGYIVKNKKIMRGKFKCGKFVSGFSITIIESGKHVTIEKFFGKLENDNYKSGEKLHRIQYKIEDGENGKCEIESYYFYQGQFKDNLENGKGISVKTFPSANYQYYYKGEFENGEMHGEGTILFEGDFFIKKYEGIFEQDKWFCQYGKVYFNSGDVFEGFFDSSNSKDMMGYYLHSFEDESSNNNNNREIKRNVKKFGELREITENEFENLNKFMSNVKVGDAFFGEFYNDKKHGIGKYIFKEQKLLVVGKYLDGERNGKFETVKNEDINEKLKDKTSIKIKQLMKKKSLNFLKITKNKMYYLFENDEIIDDSDKPFKE